MHEFSLVSSVITMVEQSAKEAGASKVTSICIVAGDLSQVVDEAMDFAFEALSEGTLCEGAKLEIEHVRPRSRCMDCQKEFDHDVYHRRCPECDSLFTELIRGKELFIDHIELDIL